MTAQLRTLYLDWFNNWLTIDAFCEHHGIHRDDAITLIELGRKYHEQHCENLRFQLEDFA